MKTNKLQYIRFEDSKILVRFQGVTRNITDSPEHVDEVLRACKEYKNNPTEENAQSLMGILVPIKKEEYSDSLMIDDNGDLFLKDNPEPIPEELANLVKSYVDQDLPIEPLVNFWMNCLDNPNEDARKGFFKYVKDFGIVVTDYGYAVLYKAVNKTNQEGGKDSKVTNENNATLSQFVSAQYMKIKGMKKSPKNYDVYEVTDFGLPEDPVSYKISTHSGDVPKIDEDNQTIRKIGNLHKMNEGVKEVSKDLETSTEKVTVYQPGHKGDHGMEIKLGQPVTMPRQECDPNINISCSYGLHVGSHKYVSSFGRSMGSILAVLVNPADVVALPRHDHSKIRVCRYFPYAEIERNRDGSWEEIETPYFEEDFLDYDYDALKERLGKLQSSESLSKDQQNEQELIEKRIVRIQSR